MTPGAVQSPLPEVAAPVNADGPRCTIRRWFARCVIGCTMAGVVWFLHWTVEANSGFEDWGDMDYFKLLVRGWQKGQLNLDKAPAPELLALADPYDPAQNQAHKLGDATLYKGKYYIYFGPTPAATLMWPYAVLTGKEMTMGKATFVFCTVAFLTASGLWLALRRRYFPDSRTLVACLGILAIGFGTHLLALAQRPMIWELPISSGIAFTLLGASAAYWALHGSRPRLAMALAGLCLGLAVGARPTCLFASVLLLVPVLHAWRVRIPGRSWWELGLSAAVPLGLCGLAIMAHNYARFENPLEWGQNYQLSGAYEGKLTHFSIRFLPHNLAIYFFQLLRWTAEFPFALAVGIEISDLPGYFGTEEVAGLAVTFPFFWFLLGLPLAIRQRNQAERLGLGLSLAILAGYAVPVMALVMCYFSTTTRYQTDFAVALSLLALVGLLGAERWAQTFRRKWGRRGLIGIAGLAVALTVGIGALMSFDYHNRSLQVTAPARWQAIDAATYQGVVGLAQRLSPVEGPRVLKVRFRSQPTGTVEKFWSARDERAAETILVEHIGHQLIRFGYRRGEDGIEWGRPLKWELNHTHTVSVQLPSLYSRTSDTVGRVLERRMEFRKRTSVAVWFSGGRALGVAVGPLPADIEAGGEVSREFTGEIRKQMSRPFRADELESGLTEPHAIRGGTLHMRVMFPDTLQAKGEPLFAAGAHYRSSIVFVQAVPGGLQFVFENYASPRVESAVFQPKPEGHLVELEMASFNPAKYGEEATGDVVVRLDGREMLRTRQVGYPFPWGAEQIGRNPFGTTCAAEFRGWLVDAKWVR